ncbi:MAG: hypothetical protein MHM6MM_006596 [Cercozoa sp. M6MM]
MHRGLIVLLALLVSTCTAVDHKRFRTWQQTAFARRQRAPQSELWQQVHYEWQEDASSVSAEGLSGVLQPVASTPEVLERLGIEGVSVKVTNLHGVLRVLFDELPAASGEAKRKRFRVPGVINEELSTPARMQQRPSGFELELDDSVTAFVKTTGSFELQLLRNGDVVTSVNTRDLLMFESTRARLAHDDVDMWQEHFDKHTVQHRVYGLPEHASSFALKDTFKEYQEPFRLYNLDVFEYELDSPMAIYGAVPLVLAPSSSSVEAALWLNAAETFVDIDYREDDVSVHWMSETGVGELLLWSAATPAESAHVLAELTGYPYLPPLFALAYHQCRWNYNSHEDVRQVTQGFDQHAIPFDVLWLDIEHTNGKRYFTWDERHFGEPARMQQELGAQGERRMVAIADPHIKVDAHWSLYQEAQEVLVRNADGSEFRGQCWPGQSAYLDLLLPEARDLWARQFDLNTYQGATPWLFTWNDMNEPSVFSGPELTMPKDATHLHGTLEHREVHQLYGQLHHGATFAGLSKRPMAAELGYEESARARPFVLTRSFFAGSQRTAAVWTGDNKAEWSHLAAAVPMLLSLSVAGISFVGADVGGFFGDPSPELLLRWYQMAALQPFFRAHAHIDSKRREPWLHGEPWTSYIRRAIERRYQLLPTVYTAFVEAHRTGAPVMRPLWYEFPGLADAYRSDQAEQSFFLGDSVLMRPVTMAGQTEVSMWLPGETQDDHWAVFDSIVELVEGTADPADRMPVTVPAGQVVTLPVSLTHAAVLLRPGTVTALKMRRRRSSGAQKHDPLSLVVVLNHEARASGRLTVDDGETDAFEQQEYADFDIDLAEDTLRVRRRPRGSFVPLNASIERIVLVNAPFTGGTHQGRRVSASRVDARVLVLHRAGRLPASAEDTSATWHLDTSDAASGVSERDRDDSDDVIKPVETDARTNDQTDAKTKTDKAEETEEQAQLSPVLQVVALLVVAVAVLLLRRRRRAALPSWQAPRASAILPRRRRRLHEESEYMPVAGAPDDLL